MHGSVLHHCLVLLVFSCSVNVADLMAAPGEAGLEGVISVSPTHSGPVRADGPSSAPLAGTEFVVRKGEETVTTFTTDAEGKFHVSLAPGHYTVSRANWNAGLGDTVRSMSRFCLAE